MGDNAEGLVQRVHLEAFRNYVHLDVELGSGFNVLAGANAQGKTNFLEALYLVATTRLLRGHRDAEAVRDGCPRAIADVELAGSQTRLSVQLERGARKRALLNGLALPRAADLIGRLPCVCVSAADLPIVRGEPSDRRLFLDLELSALFPSYLRHLSLYKRALDQRNALLKAAREYAVTAPEFEPWEGQLAEHGVALREARANYLAQLGTPTRSAHAEMGHGEAIDLAYLPRDPAETVADLSDRLAAERGLDTARGSTSSGPHRDDVEIRIEGREARLFGSQGQQRTAVIALKLGTLEVAREVRGEPPLLLLDDILSDLDAGRRERLVDVVLMRAAQAVLTCTEAEAAGRRILERARVFRVAAGVVTPE